MTKRYYKRLAQLPDGTDRLESEVSLPVSEEQLCGFLDENFIGGGMKPAVGYLILKHGLWSEAMNIAMRAEHHLAFRASWAVEWAYEQCPEGELPEWFADRMTADFASSTNGSLHRVYAKMLLDQMRFGDFAPSDTQAELLAEKCFDLIINPSTRGAVQMWCMEILAHLAPRADWIAEALTATARQISEQPDCPPGMTMACRRVFQHLRQ
ncbi:MAG: hypothetical protein LBM63_00370 [Rikenellaceae bacterium]|jgi:hypothetical protein|nr:hypothetical protein [Rikenellaceae bacterium]